MMLDKRTAQMYEIEYGLMLHSLKIAKKDNIKMYPSFYHRLVWLCHQLNQHWQTNLFRFQS